MEVNGSRGILRKIPREIRDRKKAPKKDYAGSVKPGRPIAKKYAVSADSNLFGTTGTAFFPVCPPLVRACSIHGAGGHRRLSASAQMNRDKRKSSEIP